MKGLCSLPLPHGAMGWSVVCDCGICCEIQGSVFTSSHRYCDSDAKIATGSLDSSADHCDRY